MATAETVAGPYTGLNGRVWASPAHEAASVLIGRRGFNRYTTILYGGGESPYGEPQGQLQEDGSWLAELGVSLQDPYGEPVDPARGLERVRQMFSGWTGVTITLTDEVRPELRQGYGGPNRVIQVVVQPDATLGRENGLYATYRGMTQVSEICQAWVQQQIALRREQGKSVQEKYTLTAAQKAASGICRKSRPAGTKVYATPGSYGRSTSFKKGGVARELWRFYPCDNAEAAADAVRKAFAGWVGVEVEACGVEEMVTRQRLEGHGYVAARNKVARVAVMLAPDCRPGVDSLLVPKPTGSNAPDTAAWLTKMRAWQETVAKALQLVPAELRAVMPSYAIADWLAERGFEKEAQIVREG